jgi:hypothetical protein
MAKAKDCHFLYNIPHVESFFEYYLSDKANCTVRMYQMDLAMFFEYISRILQREFSQIDVTELVRLDYTDYRVERIPIRRCDINSVDTPSGEGANNSSAVL